MTLECGGRNFEIMLITQFVLIDFIIPPPEFSGSATASALLYITELFDKRLFYLI